MKRETYERKLLTFASFQVPSAHHMTELIIFQEKRVQYEKDATVLLERFEKFLGEKKFFAGERVVRF